MKEFSGLIWRILIGTVLVMVGCEGEKTIPSSQKFAEQAVVFSIPGYGQIDSAQVFFFKKFPAKDSLVIRTTVYDISSNPKAFSFSLPLGYYTMVIIGNVASDRVFARPPYSRDSVWIDYQGQEEVPALYFGEKAFNVGVDSTGVSGMLLLTAAVELTVKNVPAVVDQIDIDLSNTIARINLNYREWELMQPPVSTSIYETQAGSTYTVSLSSFPSIGDELSYLELRCYDKEGILVYTGKSSSFPAQHGRRRVVSCSFSSAAVQTTRSIGSGTDPDVQLIWEYDEESM